MLKVLLRVRFAILVTGLLLGGLADRSSAATLHVSPKGDDANSGTEARPFATLEKAKQAVRAINQTMQEDIVVVLHGGVYSLERPLVFTADDSGRQGHDVVYRAAPNEVPVLSGGRRVTGWTADADGRWKAPSPVDSFRQLYVNGTRATRAKGPIPAEFKFFGNEGYETTNVAMADWKNPGDLEVCYAIIWAHTRCKVQSIRREGDKTILVMQQPQFTQAKTKAGVTICATDSTYLENALELLDEPGEWYLDRPTKTVYYKPRPGEDMNTVEVVAPALETIVALQGTLDKPVEHLRFEGVSFQYGNWLRPSQVGHCDVQANFITDWAKNYYTTDGGFRNCHNENLKSAANVVCHAAKAIVFNRCSFSRLGGAGLDIEYGSQNNTVVGCRFSDISGTAIQIGDILKDDHHPDDPRKIVKNNTVSNCYIHDCCLDYRGGVGICVGYTERTNLLHNEICRLPYSAISMGWGWGMEDAGGGGYNQPHRYTEPTPAKDNRIENNNIHHVMASLDDGGGIYTLGRQPGTIIRGNHVHDSRNLTSKRGWSQGIYLDEGSGFIEVTDNLVYGMTTMHCNNHAQNRIATCRIHDNLFGQKPSSPAVPGITGEAMNFDGQFDAIEVPHESKLDPEQLTLIAWIKLSEYPEGQDQRRWIVNKNANELTESHFGLVLSGKRPAAFLNIGGYNEAIGAEAIPLNAWQQIAMTYDGQTLRTYLNGKEVASKPIGKPRKPGSGPLVVGRRQDGGFYFKGALDEARLYDRALTADEIKETVQAVTEHAQLPKDLQKGLVGQWNRETTKKNAETVQKVLDNAGLESAYRDLLK
jgi:hypothetical protein